MGLHIIQKLAPKAVAHWLFSLDRLKKLHSRLIIVKTSGRTPPGLSIKMRHLMHNIAAEMQAERMAFMAIARIEKQHRLFKAEKRLRQSFGPVHISAPRPKYRRKPFSGSWLPQVFVLGQPAHDPAAQGHG